jgi:hypothetical protein
MNIVNKTLMVDIENDITLENGSISMTIIHQAYINQSDVDIELADYSNVKFLCKEITFSKLKETLNNIDIDLGLLVDEKCKELFTDEDREYLQSLYSSIKSPYTK